MEKTDSFGVNEIGPNKEQQTQLTNLASNLSNWTRTRLAIYIAAAAAPPQQKEGEKKQPSVAFRKLESALKSTICMQSSTFTSLQAKAGVWKRRRESESCGGLVQPCKASSKLIGVYYEERERERFMLEGRRRKRVGGAYAMGNLFSATITVPSAQPPPTTLQ